MFVVFRLTRDITADGWYFMCLQMTNISVPTVHTHPILFSDSDGGRLVLLTASVETTLTVSARGLGPFGTAHKAEEPVALVFHAVGLGTVARDECGLLFAAYAATFTPATYLANAFCKFELTRTFGRRFDGRVRHT